MKQVMKEHGLAAMVGMWLVIVGMTTPFAAGLAQSADKVDATVTRAESSGVQALRVRLNMAGGWHVNANPASLDFLVPTTIAATANGKAVPLTIAWPEGQDSGIELSNTSIKVYSDGIVIPVVLDTSAGNIQPTLNIRVQACSNKGLCLPPSTLHVQQS